MLISEREVHSFLHRAEAFAFRNPSQRQLRDLKLIAVCQISQKRAGDVNDTRPSQVSAAAGRSPGRLMVWSPKKRRLAMLRRYQALGKAKISLSLLMSYLKEAEPMSHTAEGRESHQNT